MPQTHKEHKKGLLMTGAQAIIECMKIEQIRKVFCVPGESYLPVLDAIYDESSIELVSARHEGGASFMAEGYAKATRRPGVVMATRGVGGANLAIGVHTAFQDSTPMVVFLGQVHSKFRGREGFQEVELDQFFNQIAKWAVEIKDVERVPELVQRAFRLAQTGRPGPVVVSLPEDILKQEAEMVFSGMAKCPKPCPSQSEADEIEAVLKKAERPIIIAGGGIIHSGAEEDLLQFAEKFCIPVLAAFRRQDVFPNHHPLYAGHLGLGTAKPVLETVKSADVILALGTRLSEVTTQDYSLLSSQQTLVHVDIDPNILGKVYPPEIGITADAQKALEILKNLEIKPSWGEWAIQCRDGHIKGSVFKAYDQSECLTNEDVIEILQNQLPESSIITNDAGNFAGWLHSYYQFKQKKTYIGPTSGAMGYGLPAAIGAKMARPDSVTVSLSGDGGMMMTFQELETAVRHKVPVISLVFNNSMFGTIRMHQEIHYPGKVSGTDLGKIDFAALAKSLGANGIAVSTKQEFSDALLEAIVGDKPTVIEIPMNRNQISTGRTITEIRKKQDRPPAGA